MKICYFTLAKTTPTRDIVYLNGLRNLGIEIIECSDYSPGLKKFWRLWQKHKALNNNYDIVLVGFSGHILVPFVRIISKKKIIFNALSSMYDGIIGSRKKYGFLGWRIPYCWLIDWVAFNSAHLTLLDTDARKKYVMRKFFISPKKLARLWSGVDDNIFVYNPEIKKLPVFTVLFRGALMNEAGIEYLVQAAKLLQNEPINFRIIGSGLNSPLLSKMLADFKLKNIEWISEHLSWEDLIKKMQECHLSIGQLSDYWRQNVHITFKTVESMALKIPYLITNNSYGMLEFLKDNETCFCVSPEDSQSLAQKILWLKNNPEKLNYVSENAYRLFQHEFTSKVLAKEMLNLINI